MKYVILILFCSVSIYAVERPFLLFSKQDIPALKQKVKSGVPGQTYKALLKHCDGLLKANKLRSSHEIDVRCDMITSLGIAYYLSGDERYRDKFIELVKLARNSKTDIVKMKYTVSLIFDMGYDFLPPAEKKYIKDLVVKQAKYYKNIKPPYWARCSNWGPIVFMRGVRSALALKGEPEYDPKTPERAAKELRQLFSNWIDDSGMPTEHGAYLDYGFIINGAMTCYILQRMGFDLVKGTNLPKLPYWIMLASSPLQPMRWNALGDSNLQPPSPYVMRLLLDLLPNNPLMNEAVARCGGRDDTISGIFYYRKPVKPAKVDCPQAMFFHASNLLAYKSDFTPQAFSVVSQARWRGGHAHADIGSFIVWAFGVPWVIDSEYGVGKASAHNLLVVDEEEPDGKNAGGRVDQCLISPFAIAFSTDSKDHWNNKYYMNVLTPTQFPVAFAERSLVIMPEDKELQVPPYVLVDDYLQKDRKRHDYTWILQVGKNAEFKNQVDRSTVTLKDEEAKDCALDVVFLNPGPDDEVEISNDKLIDYGRFQGRWHKRLLGKFAGALWGEFLVMVYPRTAKMPPLKLKRFNKYGCDFQLTWPQCTDYIKAPEFNPAKGDSLALVRLPNGIDPRKKLPVKLKYLTVKNDNFKFAGKEIFSVKNGKQYGGHFGLVSSGSCSGERLDIDVYVDPVRARLKLSYPIEVKAWGPEVKKVSLNGKSVAFTRDGDYVIVKGRNRIPVSNKQLETVKNQKFLDKGE